MIGPVVAAILSAALALPIGAPAEKPKPEPCGDRVARILYDAGFRDESLRIAWSIVHRESRGENVVPGHPQWNGADWGLWQANKPTWGSASWWSDAAMSDPRKQSRIMFRTLTKRGTYWQPWGLTSPHADGVDASSYGSWGPALWDAWIWQPYARYRAEFPKRCR